MRAVAWMLGMWLALGPSSAGAQDADRDDPAEYARELLERGDAQLESGEPEEALASFRQSGELAPSPEAAFGRARAHDAMQEWPDAAVAYDTAARRAAARSPDDPIAAAAREARERLAPRLGAVVVTVPDGEVVRVGGRLVPAERLGRPVPVLPGFVEVTATDDVGERAMTVAVEAGAEVPVRFEPRPPEPPEPVSEVEPEPLEVEDAPPEEPPPPGDDAFVFGVSFAGIAAVGWVIGAALSVAASDRFADLRMRCGGVVCPAELRPEIDGGRQIEQVSLVMLSVSGVFTFASIALLVWDAIDLDSLF